MVTRPTTAFSDVDQLDPHGYYTYEDYMTWTFPERVELYRGTPHLLSPGPNRRHQTILTYVFGSMFFYFNDSGCSLFVAPFDVRLPVSLRPGKVDTVVQPDLCVVCDKNKLDKQGCNGAPDLVVEILSPGNSPREMREKFTLYESSGVREYWLVQPETESVLIYTLDGDRYVTHQPKTSPDTMTGVIFPRLELNLDQVFAFEGEG